MHKKFWYIIIIIYWNDWDLGLREHLQRQEDTKIIRQNLGTIVS